jgi:hypothetical protein
MNHNDIVQYKWDEGLERLWPVVDSPETEFATALLIYWRLEGPWIDENILGVSSETQKMISIVKQRLLECFYKKGFLRYDPVSDNRLSKAQVHKLKRATFPIELIKPKWKE